jgi:SAM-dependent methyltransferase
MLNLTTLRRSLHMALAGSLRPRPEMRGNQQRGLSSAGEAGCVSLGDLRRLLPISAVWGFDRGVPIDRYYIEGFLERHSVDVRGHVLELGDDSYTIRFGGDRVAKCDVLTVEDSPISTYVADLTRADHIPSELFDCIIFTQALHVIYDFRSALRTLQRILKPGGVLLATFPGISQTTPGDFARWGDCWRFTAMSAERLFGEFFPAPNVAVETHGNVLSAAAFLFGLATEEMRREELDYNDPCYQLVIAVRAEKAGAAQQ